MKKKILISLLILFNSFVNFSQNTEIYEITGHVINQKNGHPVKYATVINLKKDKATICDSLGYFNITALKNDEIKIFALGFETKYINLSDTDISPSEIFTLKMKQKTYKINNVNIFEERWKDFVFDFSHTDIKKNETQEKIQEWFYALVDPKELAILTASAAVGIPINYKTKIEKQKLKVEKLKKQELENKIIESKYNPELVSELTGLNKTETIKFMRFCNFGRNFLLKANDYDVITAIRNNYERYLKIKIR